MEAETIKALQEMTYALQEVTSTINNQPSFLEGVAVAILCVLVGVALSLLLGQRSSG